MTGRIIDNLIYSVKKPEIFKHTSYLDTDFGKIRFFDSGSNKPVIITVPDAPNTIEHHEKLFKELSKNYRVVCFEYPGAGFSYPNANFDYSFKQGSDLIFQVMDILKIERASLLFSCSNGFYALSAAMRSSQQFDHIFISQTASIDSIIEWADKSIPSMLKIPIIGQVSNRLFIKKLSSVWYDVALPRDSVLKNDFKVKAHSMLHQGGCFCLSSLVQGLTKDKDSVLKLNNVNVTLVWGKRDFSHRNTDIVSIKNHVSNCEIIEFENCGHFPELENTKRFVKLVNERL
jgi:pimeloyl-ACP methyl ester carboxylesterase